MQYNYPKISETLTRDIYLALVSKHGFEAKRDLHAEAIVMATHYINQSWDYYLQGLDPSPMETMRWDKQLSNVNDPNLY